MALPHDPTTMPNPPQGGTASSTWDPSTVSNVIFSAIMVFIGVIAIWQAHQAHRRSSRTLDQEELIGLQLISRASTMLSNESHNVNPDPLPSPSRLDVPPSHDFENTRELPRDTGAERHNGEA